MTIRLCTAWPVAAPSSDQRQLMGSRDRKELGAAAGRFPLIR